MLEIQSLTMSATSSFAYAAVTETASSPAAAMPTLVIVRLLKPFFFKSCRLPFKLAEFLTALNAMPTARMPGMIRMVFWLTSSNFLRPSFEAMNFQKRPFLSGFSFLNFAKSLRMALIPATAL